jgi:hypothetical protein
MEKISDGKIKHTEEEINVNSLLDKARQLTSTKDDINAEYYANLAILSCEDNHILKIQSLGIKSFVNNKNKNIDGVLNVVRKYMHLAANKNNMTEETMLSYIRGYYRIGKLYQDNGNYFMASLFLYKANMLANSQEGDIKNEIEQWFYKAIDEVAKIIKGQASKIKQNMDFLESCKTYFKTSHHNLDNGDAEVYLVSNLWLNNLINYLDKDPLNDKFLNRSNVLHLYFNDGSNKEDYKKYQGSYPGPVNNFYIIEAKDYWYDPLPSELYTNVYLRLDARENVDFIYLTKDIWTNLKEFFDCNFEIERRFLSKGKIETHLKRIKILVLSDLLVPNAKNLIKPRYIQLSKFDTVAQLKSKILRCLSNSLHMDINADNVKTNIYIPEFTEHRDRELFQIIHAYAEGFDSLNLKGIEVLDDGQQINVRLCVNNLGPKTGNEGYDCC